METVSSCINLQRFSRKNTQSVCSRPPWQLPVCQRVFLNRRRKEQTMEDDLGRWIQEAVLSSYLEECKIFNELDASYGFDYHFSSEFPGGSFPARKRKLSPSSCEDNSFSAGKQTKNCWRRFDPAVAVLGSQKPDKRSIAFTKEIPVRKKE